MARAPSSASSPVKPAHLTEREWRIAVWLDGMAQAHRQMAQQIKFKFGEAAPINLAVEEGAVRALRKAARGIKSGRVPGW